MRLHRLRITVDDEPGRFAMVAAGLGAMGVNIVDIDIHSGADGERVDELTADLTLPLDTPAIGHAVTSAGGRLLDISPVDAHVLRDGVTAAIELATRLVADGTPD